MTVNPQHHPLRRSRHNRIIAGVCGGLAEFFGISAFWFRIAFLIALIPGGVPGTVLGVLILAVLGNLLNLKGVSPFVQMVLQGGIIVIAVVVSELRRRRR